jgi:hypothetical protein
VMTIRRGDDKGGWIRYEEQIRRRHWTLVAADGTFEIPAAAGTYELEAIDVATGVTLARIEDPVTVAAGKPTKRDLRVDVVAAKVLFETADKGRLNTERVEIRVGTDAGDGRVTMFAGGQRGTPGVDLAGAREVLFFVPPGPVRLRAEVGAMLAGRNFQWGSEPHAEETFEAELGKVSEVTMTLPPPADLGGK